MFTRRRFLLILPTLAALPRLVSAQSLLAPLRRKPVPAQPVFVFFGTDTAKGISKGIYLSRFDPASGLMTQPQLAAETLRPSYLAISPNTVGQRRLYAVNAVPSASATVTSFLIDSATGALHPINQVTSAGAGPCYISLDATGEAAFVANYNGSSIASYRVLPSGALSEPVARIDYKDRRFGHRGPNAARQDVPHPHSVHLSPDNRFLLVNDLGSDAISVFAIDPATARLGQPALFSNNRPGSGPRHIAFHPNGRWVYSINELDSTIDRFLWTTTSSRTAPQGLLVNTGAPVKTIAPNFPVAKNTAAEVSVSLDGNFLYASNRGEDTLVVFAIAPADGALSLVQRISCGGKTPRHFTLDPSERWLLCGNQDSATVTVFHRDSASGRIGGPTQTLPLDSVMFSLFA
ncbi:MAG: lactonase family protein [Acidobacteriaceae bacterium]